MVHKTNEFHIRIIYRTLQKTYIIGNFDSLDLGILVNLNFFI